MKLTKDTLIENNIYKKGTEISILQEYLDDIDDNLKVEDLSYEGQGWDKKDNIKYIFKHKRIDRWYAVLRNKVLYKQNNSGNPVGRIKHINFNDLIHLISEEDLNKSL